MSVYNAREKLSQNWQVSFKSNQIKHNLLRRPRITKHLSIRNRVKYNQDFRKQFPSSARYKLLFPVKEGELYRESGSPFCSFRGRWYSAQLVFNYLSLIRCRAELAPRCTSICGHGFQGTMYDRASTKPILVATNQFSQNVDCNLVAVWANDTALRHKAFHIQTYLMPIKNPFYYEKRGWK